ncbi:MAG: RloB family protein [Firmicutes bacterium]|nr:RloB family protein [Bacillota bacterium]
MKANPAGLHRGWGAFLRSLAGACGYWGCWRLEFGFGTRGTGGTPAIRQLLAGACGYWGYWRLDFGLGPGGQAGRLRSCNYWRGLVVIGVAGGWRLVWGPGGQAGRLRSGNYWRGLVVIGVAGGWRLVLEPDQTEDVLFNQAIITAANNGIHTAFSNTCFELWFLLHFEYMDNPINDNKDLFRKLTKHLNEEYKKNDKDIYRKIKKSKETAINRAEKPESLHKDKCGNQAKWNPCTTVHKLVKRLHEFC